MNTTQSISDHGPAPGVEPAANGTRGMYGCGYGYYGHPAGFIGVKLLFVALLVAWLTGFISGWWVLGVMILAWTIVPAIAYNSAQSNRKLALFWGLVGLTAMVLLGAAFASSQGWVPALF